MDAAKRVPLAVVLESLFWLAGSSQHDGETGSSPKRFWALVLVDGESNHYPASQQNPDAVKDIASGADRPRAGVSFLDGSSPYVASDGGGVYHVDGAAVKVEVSYQNSEESRKEMIANADWLNWR